MDQFKEFTATELYCNNCKQAMPVRETLLLVLSDGDMYGYRCSRCGQYLGTRKNSKGKTFR
ncbi:MAG: hypothetical protein KKH94_02960 [Candidatus Omnitrophica bacterium]|nr:hypothetical protein [Candidatus Omnitrophota bacterium]